VRIRAAVITISDKGYAGLREDVSGPCLAAALREMGAEVLWERIVPDVPEMISETLTALADETGVDLIVTTGGTGAAPRDRTPGQRGPLSIANCRASPRCSVSRGTGRRRSLCSRGGSLDCAVAA